MGPLPLDDSDPERSLVATPTLVGPFALHVTCAATLPTIIGENPRSQCRDFVKAQYLGQCEATHFKFAVETCHDMHHVAEVTTSTK